MSGFVFSDYDGRYSGAIADMEKKCFSKPWSIKAIEEFMSFDINNIFLAIDKDGEDKLASYISFTDVCGELQIANVATDEAYRRRGAASFLIEKLKEYAADNNSHLITLEVRSSNNAAVSLYKKHGFEEVGVRKNYYSDPTEDAVLMNFYL